MATSAEDERSPWKSIALIIMLLEVSKRVKLQHKLIRLKPVFARPKLSTDLPAHVQTPASAAHLSMNQQLDGALMCHVDATARPTLPNVVSDSTE